MVSPEYPFQPPIFFGPDNAKGGTPSGSEEPEDTSQDCVTGDHPSPSANENIPGVTDIPSNLDFQAETEFSSSDDIVQEPGSTESGDVSYIETEWKVAGRGDFNWRTTLSEDGQKLYRLLLYDMGDREYLPLHASEEGWDLEAALDELRRHELIDESDSATITLK